MSFEMSLEATGDLDEIIDYTLERWGEDEVNKYVGELEEKLNSIGKGDEIKKRFGIKFSNLYVTRYRFHMIYYLTELGKVPLIIRILHVKRDKLRHLEKTLIRLQWKKGDKPIDLS